VSVSDVSVVIPSFNRRAALEKCLNALNHQNISGFEVVVVDDGSSDGTIDMLETWRTRELRFALCVVRNVENLGANRSRNAGIRAARGTLIAFLDSDCIPAKDWVERISALFDDPSVAAATGLVEEDSPRNIFERALWGGNRVHGRGRAKRLVAGNLCVRREWLERFPFDEDLKYGCDEEGLYLKLRAVGATQWLAADARVTHEHRYDGRGFLRQAWVGGRAAAWLVYKYHLWPRVDLLPLTLAYLTIPLVLLNGPMRFLPLLFFALQLAAILYNDICRKRKNALTSLLTLPPLIIFYHVRLAGYVVTALRLRAHRGCVERVSLRALASDATAREAARAT